MVKYVASDPTPPQPQHPPVIPPVENSLPPLPSTPTIYNYAYPSVPDPSTPNIPDPSIPNPSAPNICVDVHGVIWEEDSNMEKKFNGCSQKRKFSMKTPYGSRIFSGCEEGNLRR